LAQSRTPPRRTGGAGSEPEKVDIYVGRRLAGAVDHDPEHQTPWRARAAWTAAHRIFRL